MKTVWKFPLQVTASQVIAVPEGAKGLSAHMQAGTLTLWAMVDTPHQNIEAREVRIHGTGHPINDDIGVFVGTVMIDDGALVFHVFVQPAAKAGA